MKKILILEPGAWGTALGVILSKRNKVGFFYENEWLSGKISDDRTNERLPSIRIPNNIAISADLKKLIKDVDLIIIASPSFGLRKTLRNLQEFKNLPPLLGIAKGLEKETLKISSQIVEEILGKTPYVHLSGPGFAKEIVMGKIAKEVIASENDGLLKFVKEIFSTGPFKIFVTKDIIGTQLAGAFKNTLSIGISLAEAECQNTEVFGVKENLIQLGTKEMAKLGQAMGAKRETFWGPAGIEDLILTSGNPLSRNYQFGKFLLSDAEKVRKEVREGEITVEGFDNAFVLQKLAKKYKLALPMIKEIYETIYKITLPQKTAQNLIKLANQYKASR